MASGGYEAEFGLRENKADADWSVWIRVVVPEKEEGFSRPIRGDCGYINGNLSSSIKSNCGIYEIAIAREDKIPVAVYLGSTCRANGKIVTRIKEHFFGDSDGKTNLINDALCNKYTIYARYRRSYPDEVPKARADENDLLKQYDYAWNKRNNGTRRNIHP